nr:hypothetical protein GCM10025732_28800 [Glycomyces mayteni]
MDPGEALARLLVRTAASGPTWPGRDRPAAAPDPAVLDAVARAYAANDRAAALGIDLDRLDTGAVRHYLQQLWRLTDATPEARTAAARDRGFRDFGTAAEATRQFILSQLGPNLWNLLHRRRTETGRPPA